MLAFHLLMLLHGPSVIHPRGVVHFPFSHGLSAICPRGIVRFRMLTPVQRIGQFFFTSFVEPREFQMGRLVPSKITQACNSTLIAVRPAALCDRDFQMGRCVPSKTVPSDQKLHHFLLANVSNCLKETASTTRKCMCCKKKVRKVSPSLRLIKNTVSFHLNFQR